MTQPHIVENIGNYYSEKLQAHGDSAKGVDWNSTESQFLRFDQLLKLIPANESDFSIADLGCGYGALIDRLDTLGRPYSFYGYDVAEAMIAKAKELYQHNERAHFEVASRPTKMADYVVASGIFNVRMQHSVEEWERYVFDTIDAMHETSRKGFAFNMLTAYSDADKMRDNLYYPSPEEMFGLMKKKYSRNVSLLHDYELYEFTLLIRKNG